MAVINDFSTNYMKGKALGLNQTYNTTYLVIQYT